MFNLSLLKNLLVSSWFSLSNQHINMFPYWLWSILSYTTHIMLPSNSFKLLPIFRFLVPAFSLFLSSFLTNLCSLFLPFLCFFSYLIRFQASYSLGVCFTYLVHQLASKCLTPHASNSQISFLCLHLTLLHFSALFPLFSLLVLLFYQNWSLLLGRYLFHLHGSSYKLQNKATSCF